jgi:quercetin dioxygenase-like cupin family protein
MADISRLESQLREQRYSHTLVWQDSANAEHADHTHPVETAHIIPEGEMTLIIGGIERTFRAGERCDVPAGEIHSAKMGPRGRRYLIGER